ncbi:MAG: hypothetical protein IKS41_07395 [Alphaproteobacteria bacterium]|nr:hypothetical protein [Alphaproteobacteria bacterium]
MKKIFALLLVIIGFFFFLMKRGEQIALDSIPQNALVVFTKTGCYHCHDAMTFINADVKKQFPALPILNWDIDHDNNFARLMALAKRHRIPHDRLGTPVIYFNGQILVGWDERYEQKLLDIVKTNIAPPRKR